MERQKWFKQYFDEMQKIFRLKRNAVDLAMSKVDSILNARDKGIKLSGLKEAYAVNILQLVALELELHHLDWKTIQKAANVKKYPRA